MKSFLLTRLLPALAVVVAFGEVVLAQTGSPLPTNPTNPTAIPLDGGVSLLLAGGVAYGIKRLRDRKRA